jgi:hypothetical protein
MEPDRLEAVIAAVVKELEAALPAAPAPPPPPAEAKAPPPAAAPAPAAPGPRPGSTPPAQGPDLRIDLPDPTLP